MKRYFYFSFLMMAAALTGCTTEPTAQPAGAEMRTVTVVGDLTRTSIEYEGSEVSHLVWCEGDQVAYVSDVANEKVATATVESNAFEAELNSAAKAITVAYPVAENKGLTASELELTTIADQSQAVDEPFEGERLPLAAYAELSGNESTINVSYKALASVLCINLLPSTEPTEVVSKVEFSAGQNLVGTYHYEGNGEWSFTGSEKVITATLTGDEESLMLTSKPRVQLVAHSDIYTDVKLTITTDLNTYTYAGGTMDLTHPTRRVYHIDIDLATYGEQPQPEEPTYFTEILDLESLTAEGEYLLATKTGTEGSYTLLGNSITDRSNPYYINCVEMTYTDEGVEVTEESLSYIWKIEKDETGYTLYSPAMSRYIGSQGGEGMLYGYGSGEGKLWVKTATEWENQTDWDAELQHHWNITFSDDCAKIESCYNKFSQSAFLKYSPDRGYPVICYEDYGISATEIHILKRQ